MPSPPILAIVVLGLIPRVVLRIKMHLARMFGRTRAESEDRPMPNVPNERDVPVLDISVFRELHVTLGSNTERVRNVYAKFLDTAAKRVDELRQQPPAASPKTFHALKGSAGMVGATRLAALAARLQEATVDPDMIANAVVAIERELAAFHGVLNAQLESVSGAQ